MIMSCVHFLKNKRGRVGGGRRKSKFPGIVSLRGRSCCLQPSCLPPISFAQIGKEPGLLPLPLTLPSSSLFPAAHLLPPKINTHMKLQSCHLFLPEGADCPVVAHTHRAGDVRGGAGLQVEVRLQGSRRRGRGVISPYRVEDSGAQATPATKMQALEE